MGNGPTNRDFFPLLEFQSPLGFFDDDPEIAVKISKASPESLPQGLFRGFSSVQLEAANGRRRLGNALIRFYQQLTVSHFDETLAEYRVFAEAGDDWALDCAARKISEVAPNLGDRGSEILHAAREIHDAPELCLVDNFRPGPQGDPASQLKVYLRAAEKAPATRWEPYFALARVQAQLGQAAEALKSLEIAQKRHAPRYRVAFVRGVALGMTGDLEAAEKWLRQAFELTPVTLEHDRGEAAYNLGFCLEKRGRFDEALSSHRQAAAQKNDPVRSWMAQARCLLRLGDEAGAAEFMFQVARARSTAGKLNEALQWMEAAVKTAPGRFERELEEMRAGKR